MVKRLKEALKIVPAFRFLHKWIKWKWAGGRFNSVEEINRRFKICEACPEAATFDENELQCTKCRCFIQRDAQTVWNKAAWETEGCPLKKWVASQPEGSPSTP